MERRQEGDHNYKLENSHEHHQWNQLEKLKHKSHKIHKDKHSWQKEKLQSVIFTTTKQTDFKRIFNWYNGEY